MTTENQPQETPTPRTDAFIRELGHYPNLVNPNRQRYDAMKTLARTLERELTATQRELTTISGTLKTYGLDVAILNDMLAQRRVAFEKAQRESARLAERVRELEKDRAILDFLQANIFEGQVWTIVKHHDYIVTGTDENLRETFKTIIDHERTAPPQPDEKGGARKMPEPEQMHGAADGQGGSDYES